MPRGSKPGERRGGRQRGTPNKNTELKNAVFLAAAQHRSSPLDFMLGLMRDPKIPTDLRLDMAVAAAPFAHAKPQAPPRVRTNPMDSSPIKGLPDAIPPEPDPIKSRPDSIQPKMEEELKGLEQPGENGVDLNPLQFLLSVMKDPDATPQQRIKAARVAARYTHAAMPPDKLAAVDEYGFAISRTLAKTIGDDWVRLKLLESGRLGGVMTTSHLNEAAAIYARQAQRDEFLQCPPGYSSRLDEERLAVLQPYWPPRDDLSMAEQTELGYVVARITAAGVSYRRTPEGRASRRLDELSGKETIRQVGKIGPVGLTPEEKSEREQLYEKFPSLKPEPYRVPLPPFWNDFYYGKEGRSE
jgi:hypothetical protein